MNTTSKGRSAYKQLLGRIREASLLGTTASLLHWDQQAMMPPRGLAHRSKQIAQLARLAHEMETDPNIGQFLDQCEADDELMADSLGDQAVNVREIRRNYERATKLPVALVEELAQTSSVAQGEWAEARRTNDYSRFQPWFTKLVDLQRQKADCLGWERSHPSGGGEPWDALADDFEPGCTAKQTEAIFAPLRVQLVIFIEELMSSRRPPSEALLRLNFETERMKPFVKSVAEHIGFDFASGRLDKSTHPFCSGMHCHDVRMTTRYCEANPVEPLFSTIHETGHGLYGQGLPHEHMGTPLGWSVSLGIHESQSRMWENLVGRSLPFWRWCLPKLRQYFGSAATGLSLEDAYAGANLVKPAFIRIEADEATYNLHIMVRFEIERALMNGDLTVADVPGVWNEKYNQYFGLDIPDDTRGCLQDIHWSQAGIGYFPTYTLGNLYAAQFFAKALADIPDLHDQFAQGEFATLRSWLHEHIHRHGMRYRAAELCERVTGEPPSAAPFMHHLEDKLRPIYGL